MKIEVADDFSVGKFHWNHRVVRRVYHHSGHEEVTYAIHEAHYREEGKGSGKCDITMNPTDVSGESVDDLKWTLEHMLKALDKPVLDYDTREEIADGSTQKQATGDSGLLPRGPVRRGQSGLPTG